MRRGPRHSPTLTDVRPSSSEALLPPPALLDVLIRLLLLWVGRIMALCGRWGGFPGEFGGEVIVVGGRKVGGEGVVAVFMRIQVPRANRALPTPYQAMTGYNRWRA